MSNYLVTDTELTSIADTIRTKSGQSGSLSFPTGFISGIESISSGGSELLITITGDTLYTMDKTFGEIKAAMESGIVPVVVTQNATGMSFYIVIRLEADTNTRHVYLSGFIGSKDYFSASSDDAYPTYYSDN